MGGSRSQKSLRMYALSAQNWVENILILMRSFSQFLDGQSYSKGKLEEAFRTLHLDRPYPKPGKAAPSQFKAEDLDVIVSP